MRYACPRGGRKFARWWSRPALKKISSKSYGFKYPIIGYLGIGEAITMQALGKHKIIWYLYLAPSGRLYSTKKHHGAKCWLGLAFGELGMKEWILLVVPMCCNTLQQFPFSLSFLHSRPRP